MTSTNKNCQAGDLECVEIGHPKDDNGKPVLNYSIAYDHNNSEPLYYEEYPGSIVDVSQLQIMLLKAKGYGYRQVVDLFLTVDISARKTFTSWIRPSRVHYHDERNEITCPWSCSVS